MLPKPKNLFYGLAALILMFAWFTLHNDTSLGERGEDMSRFRSEIKQAVTIAALQTWGHQPLYHELDLVWQGLNDFYVQSADNLIALFEPTEYEQDMLAIIQKTSLAVAAALEQSKPSPGKTKVAELVDLGLYMQEEPIYNIMPVTSNLWEDEGNIAGEYVVVDSPANQENGWVTLQDNINGRLYCLAIYNNVVNKYSGPCKYDIAY